MAKYHGDGDANSPIVQLQLHEITEDFAVTRNDNPWWDFKELFHTRAARYRLAMVIAMAFFGQWSGNNVVSCAYNPLLLFSMTILRNMTDYKKTFFH